MPHAASVRQRLLLIYARAMHNLTHGDGGHAQRVRVVATYCQPASRHMHIIGPQCYGEMIAEATSTSQKRCDTKLALTRSTASTARSPHRSNTTARSS